MGGPLLVVQTVGWAKLFLRMCTESMKLSKNRRNESRESQYKGVKGYCGQGKTLTRGFWVTVS